MEEPVLYPWKLDAYHLSHPYGGTSVVPLKARCLPSKSSVWRNQCCTPESSMLTILVIRMEEPVLYPWKLYVYHLSHPYEGTSVVPESSMFTILVIRMKEPVLCLKALCLPSKSSVWRNQCCTWNLDAYHLSHPYEGTSVVLLKSRCLPSKSSVWRNQCCTWNLDAYHLSHPYEGTSVVPESSMFTILVIRMKEPVLYLKALCLPS